MSDSGLAVTWADVRIKIKETEALRGVSGSAQPGRLTALMGPSGSGKTTLLTAIAHRIAITSGTVRFGGLAWSKALRRRVAFVEQDDIVTAELTVRESLSFLARLRLDLDDAAIEARVSETIKLLRLEACEHTKVGSAMVRGISGGERKRLCIGQEMLVEPAVMLLDEPTSGLDSSMAMITVEVLAELARKTSMVIICSIHQPSSQIFHAFDDLLLLNKGETVYAGAVGLTSAYFAKGLGLACPPDWNPADFMMDLCVQGKLDSDKARAQIRADADKRRAALGGGGAHTSDKDAETLEEDVRQRYVKPWSYQLKVLLQREWAVRKGSLWDQNQLLLHAGIAVLGGVMWFGTAYGERDIFPRFTASFAVILQWIFFPFLDNLFVFTLAEVQLRKELRVGAYRLSSWFVAKTTAGLLPYAIWPLLHVTILYWMANVNGIGGAPFVVTMALVYLTILLFQSFSLALGAVFSPGRVMTVALLCMTAMFLFTGVFIPLEQTPLPWIGFLNPLLYCLQAVVGVTIGWGRPYACNDGVRVGTAFPDVCTGTPGALISPERALENVGVWASVELAVGVMVAYTAVLRFLAFRALRARMRDAHSPGAAGAALAWLRTWLQEAKGTPRANVQVGGRPSAGLAPAADHV